MEFKVFGASIVNCRRDACFNLILIELDTVSIMWDETIQVQQEHELIYGIRFINTSSCLMFKEKKSLQKGFTGEGLSHESFWN